MEAPPCHQIPQGIQSVGEQLLFEVSHYGQIPDFHGAKTEASLNQNTETRTWDNNAILSAKDVTTVTESHIFCKRCYNCDKGKAETRATADMGTVQTPQLMRHRNWNLLGSSTSVMVISRIWEPP